MVYMDAMIIITSLCCMYEWAMGGEDELLVGPCMHTSMSSGTRAGAYMAKYFFHCDCVAWLGVDSTVPVFTQTSIFVSAMVNQQGVPCPGLCPGLWGLVCEGRRFQEFQRAIEWVQTKQRV